MQLPPTEGDAPHAQEKELRRSRLAGLFGLFALVTLGGCKVTETTSGEAGGNTTTTSPSSEGGGGEGGATTTSSTTTSSTTREAIFCPVPVTEPAVTTGECDLLQQSCPPGETCTLTQDTKSTICKLGGGLKGPGKPCDTDQECQAGLFCVGFCSQVCCPATDQPCVGGDCNVELTFGNVVLLVCSYTEPCTLFGQDTCPAGQKCQFVYEEKGLAVCTINAAKAVPEGQPCAYINECASNQLCYGGVCRYNCKLSGGGTPGTGACPASQACQKVFSEAAGDVGVCQ